jgi:hypothetical protein
MVNFLKLSFLLFTVSLVCSVPVPEVPKHIELSKNDSHPLIFKDNVEQINHATSDNANQMHSRKLLLSIKKVVSSIIKKSPPPPPPPPPPKPAPKAAPAPAPKPAPKAAPAPAPKAAPAPVPKPAPAPAPAPKAAPSPAPKAAPAPAPKAAPAPAPKALNVNVNLPKTIAVTLPSPVSSPVVAPLPSPIPAKNFPIFVTCDNQFDLYVNGVKVGSGNTWTTTYQFTPLVKPGDVIAIDGVDVGGPAAFIGVFDGKVTKASDWKCSLKEESGWTKNEFNDASWSKAVSYGRNQDSNIWRSVGGGSRPNIPGDAEWLWTNNNENHNRVYCRYRPIPAQPTVSQVVAPKAVTTTTIAPTFKISSVLNDWIKTPAGQSANNFCISLGIQNNADVYSGCLEDMRVTKSEAIAKESALTAMEFASKDKEAFPSKRFCVAAGDPHCTNYDGDFFHIQEQGIYTIATSRDGLFEIQEKIVKNGANKVGVPSCIVGALVRYKQITIEVDVSNFKKLRVNGIEVDLKQDDTIKYGGVTIRYGKQNIEWRGEKVSKLGLKMNTPEGFGVLIEGGYCGVLETSVPTSYYGKMGGICGNGDGVKNNADYFAPNGVVMDVKRGTKNWEMSGYNGPTSPLSKWQLAWKPTGSNCYFAKECEPSPQLPQQVSIKTIPVAAPVVAPVAAPKVVPVVAPVAAPKVAPVVTPVSAPKVAPVVAPVAAPKVAPVVAPVVAPKVAPVVAPVAEPKSTPVAAPKATPVVAPKVIPVSAPVATPKVIPVAAPVATPKATPVAAPKVTPVTTPKPTPVTSLKKDEDKLKKLLKDSKDTHGFSRDKLQKLKKNIEKLIGDEKKNKEAELSEFQKTILFSEDDLKKLNKKYDEKVAGLLALNTSITKLQLTMQQHYKQMLSDAKYLLLLDKIKPNYLKTLTSLNEQVGTIKDTIKTNIVEGNDKAHMLKIIYEMNDKTTNYTSVLTKEFINHYNKYKQKAGLDKAEYDNEYKKLEIFNKKYQDERKIRDSYFKEYENAKKILKQLQSNYKMEADDIDSFKKLEEFIEKVFNNNNKC